jgi:hypothetical protein
MCDDAMKMKMRGDEGEEQFGGENLPGKMS